MKRGGRNKILELGELKLILEAEAPAESGSESTKHQFTRSLILPIPSLYVQALMLPSNYYPSRYLCFSHLVNPHLILLNSSRNSDATRNDNPV